MSGFLTGGFWTLASRILGFVRDAMILAWLGTGPAYEAFVVAFRLPNMFRRFFAEGAFNTAFVPIFSKKIQGGEDAGAFAREAFSGLLTVLIALTLLAQLAMPWLIWGLASGFAGQEQFALSVEFGRIAFPYILFISLAALLSGVLNALGHFAARALVWGIPFAGIAQALLVWFAAKKAGILVLPGRPRWSPEMKHLVAVAVPAALAGGVVQVNLLVGQQVASYFDRAVGWLYAADRLYQLPLGVVGIAIGVVLLPDLSRRLKAQDDAGARDALSRASEISLALTLPSAVALVVIPIPLVSVLFQRGATTADDVAAIALAVMVYGLGLPAFVLQKLLQPLFYARENTKAPFRYALGAMIVNAAIAIGLAPVIGWIACAIATTLAAWAMVALLYMGTRPMGDVARFDARFRKRMPRIVLASLMMGGVLWVAMVGLTPFLGMPGWRYLALLVLIVLGMGSYFSFAHVLGALKFSEFKGAFRRKR